MTNLIMNSSRKTYRPAMLELIATLAVPCTVPFFAVTVPVTSITLMPLALETVSPSSKSPVPETFTVLLLASIPLCSAAVP